MVGDALQQGRRLGQRGALQRSVAPAGGDRAEQPAAAEQRDPDRRLQPEPLQHQLQGRRDGAGVEHQRLSSGEQVSQLGGLGRLDRQCEQRVVQLRRQARGVGRPDLAELGVPQPDGRGVARQHLGQRGRDDPGEVRHLMGAGHRVRQPGEGDRTALLPAHGLQGGVALPGQATDGVACLDPLAAGLRLAGHRHAPHPPPGPGGPATLPRGRTAWSCALRRSGLSRGCVDGTTDRLATTSVIRRDGDPGEEGAGGAGRRAGRRPGFAGASRSAGDGGGRCDCAGIR